MSVLDAWPYELFLNIFGSQAEINLSMSVGTVFIVHLFFISFPGECEKMTLTETLPKSSFILSSTMCLLLAVKALTFFFFFFFVERVCLYPY